MEYVTLELSKDATLNVEDLLSENLEEGIKVEFHPKSIIALTLLSQKY